MNRPRRDKEYRGIVVDKWFGGAVVGQVSLGVTDYFEIEGGDIADKAHLRRGIFGGEVEPRKRIGVGT